MAELRRTIWLATLLTAVGLSSYGSEATGSLRFSSCDFLKRYRLTLTRYRGQNLKQIIVLEIPGDWVLQHDTKEWLDVSGMECAGDDSCITVTGKIRDIRIHGLRSMSAISGNFVVQFLDGSTMQELIQREVPEAVDDNHLRIAGWRG